MGESVYLNFRNNMTVHLSCHMLGRFPQDKVEVDRSYKADWTKEQFDALNKGVITH